MDSTAKDSTMKNRLISTTREQAIAEWGEIATGDETTLTLPKVFYADHIERGNTTGVFVAENKNVIKVSMTRGEIGDLLSDADYYSDSYTASEMGMRGLAQSAKRTIAAIGRQIPIVHEYNPRTCMRTWRLAPVEVAA